ncbi:sugar phosphate isomerase/epimerase [Marinilongibacter aquaticus]|uniref:sugar phosphate isomerase/epimerase family protein n=1 Tax=Marinilongibacter aquaticus TaxID=2975157 RepID=UPI0021BD4FD0|nr:sugar phosphate isomerase/epimerase family protein [Marinilongibacter aquaticus]UBM59248.1 sugar phosphate isomerase/epimerase [Marinilongibacter aquaticus]
MIRRQFIKSAALTSVSALSFSPSFALKTAAERKFKIALNPGNIGVKGNLMEILDYAIQYGYEAISPYTQEVMNTYSDGQLRDFLDKFKAHNMSYDSVNLPVDYKKSRTSFNTEFKDLRRFCETMEKQGATRMNTWIMSSDDNLTYTENMKRTAYRLGECARVAKDYGISLGLEYLGPRTLVSLLRYPFIASMKEGKELIGEIGESNVGLVLDSFHWYCANDTIDDIRTLKPEDIITADINDARAGFTRVTQTEGKRELPLATGVINAKDFLQGLLDIGYDGPLRTEPFNKDLNDMDNDTALQINLDSVKKAFKQVGIQ